jgi:hypothetical protein
MEFQLNLEFELDDQHFSLETLISDFDSHKDNLSDIVREEGRILVKHSSVKDSGDYSEPLIRLAGQWLRKLQWIIAGDSETIPFRNSEQCFAFMPAGGGVELSLFEMGDALLSLLDKVDASLVDDDEDCRDLKSDLDESKKAWHNYELHRR